MLVYQTFTLIKTTRAQAHTLTHTHSHTHTHTHTHTHILTFVHLAPTYLCLSPQEWCCSGSPSAYPQALGDRGRKEEREGEREGERERHEEERKRTLTFKFSLSAVKQEIQ